MKLWLNSFDGDDQEYIDICMVSFAKCLFFGNLLLSAIVWGGLLLFAFVIGFLSAFMY